MASGEYEIGLRLGAALWPLWDYRGHMFEGQQWIERLLALESPNARASQSIRMKALRVAGWQGFYRLLFGAETNPARPHTCCSGNGRLRPESAGNNGSVRSRHQLLMEGSAVVSRRTGRPQAVAGADARSCREVRDGRRCGPGDRECVGAGSGRLQRAPRANHRRVAG